ncbi:MAG: serine hydrolase [Desulfobacteraceae bacterium]|nr:serine hydrolase [Desulfobacteraceae bacterium]
MELERCSFFKMLIIISAVFMILANSIHGEEFPFVNAVSSGKTGIIVDFSRTMDDSTVNKDTFVVKVVLKGIGWGTLAGKVDCDGAVAVFSPCADLIPGLEYTVTIADGVRDLSGNSPESDWLGSFVIPNINPALAESLQAMLDRITAENDDIHNAALLVEAPGFKWKGSSGMANPEEETAMLPDNQFKSTSIAKMMLATMVVKLSEAGQIGLDDKIGQYLSESVMKGLHEYEGQSLGGSITIRQLLNHTSGLRDYVFDQESDFIQIMLENPDKLWSPEETIEYVKQNLPPLFPPGQGANYADTNYQLAGLIIEKVVGKPLHESYRQLLFDPLHMEHTYMEFRETPRPAIPGRLPSHVYMDDFDYTSMRTLSAEWGGGGLQTTTEDMNRFIRAFVQNGIFADLSLKEDMLKWINLGYGIYYGLGVSRIVFDETGAELGEILGHDGVSNSFMMYWQNEDVTICGTLNQNQPEKAGWIDLILQVMAMIRDNLE